MTPRYRAESLLDAVGKLSEDKREELIIRIERVFTDADKAAEVEREACAKIADEEAESVVDDKAFSSADTIARNIRARGGKS